MKKKAHIIKEIELGSIAEELELTPGDELISINGTLIKDVLDYRLLIPDVMLRNGETVLLDDVTVDGMEKTLQTKIRIVQSDGKSFIDSIIL